MAVSSSYKEYQRLERIMTVEDVFNLGMSYTDTPLREGFAKLLVNFDLKNQGTSLVPRGGLKAVHETIGGENLDAVYYGLNGAHAIHHTGTALVESFDGTDATLRKYIFIASVVPPNFLGEEDYTPYAFFNMDVMQCYIEVEDGVYISAVRVIAPDTTGTFSTPPKIKLKNIHNNGVEQAYEALQGMFISLEANTYIPVHVVSGDYNAAFIHLKLKFTALNNSTASFSLVPVEAKEIKASQAINTGYNMLKADPYHFKNYSNDFNTYLIDGITPRDSDGNIKLTVDVGESVYYHLHYSYPEDAYGNELIRTQWELTDINGNGETRVIQHALNSANVLAGNPIILHHQVSHKQYTLTVKLYKYADIAAYLVSSEPNKDFDRMVQPERVMTVSSYYSSADVAKNTTNLTPKNYELGLCTGTCVWQQRAVIWGVPEAVNTIFMSQPNMLEYFPYPNNIEIFDEEVVHCVAYLDALLVFTTNRLYRLVMQTDGVNTFYTSKCIQENLPMTKEDAGTVCVVKNMVYFKSKNYFYMLVPNTKAGLGEVQLAPVSTPIEGLLDNFKNEIKTILADVYNIKHMYELFNTTTDYFDIIFADYANYVNGATVCNVYKIKLKIYKDNVLIDTLYVDVLLNYDTTTRAWTVYMYECTKFPLLLYQNTVTTGATFVTLTDVLSPTLYLTELALDIATFDKESPTDELPLTKGESAQRTLPNYQLLDTGYRTHYPQHKKRFREIQFSINNTSKDMLQFYTAFTVDDDLRKDIYEYAVKHITDEDDPNYGSLFVEQTLANPVMPDVPGVIGLDEHAGWALDFAKFDNITVAKVKYRVSGKGYNGKVKIISHNEKPYEFLGMNWVYRKMNGR